MSSRPARPASVRRRQRVSPVARGGAPQLRNVLNQRILAIAAGAQGTWVLKRCLPDWKRHRKLLIFKDLIGWEAGIRTPITWSRERCTRSLPLPSVRFHAVLFVTASVCSFLFACARVQRVSLCLIVSQGHPARFVSWHFDRRRSASQASSASSHTCTNASSGRNQTARRPVAESAVRSFEPFDPSSRWTAKA